MTYEQQWQVVMQQLASSPVETKAKVLQALQKEVEGTSCNRAEVSYASK
ncbi:hypothetical protein B0H94_12119 [Salsuginibacillus halophilus]|uniref:Uncharacterized protein n=1 Tax=Salsuginibacillus halophilus TaxID=517424 RepID=A0A2P8H3Q5_9BACI|nr:hypothetical protein [Salsuginibacillus halophilus]PSL40854.1 hypothetical protein B0H94_12119 [Salsuginibacillus halophilus]